MANTDPIIAKLKNDNPDLSFTIDEIEIQNVDGDGNLVTETIPAQDTEPDARLGFSNIFEYITRSITEVSSTPVTLDDKTQVVICTLGTATITLPTLTGADPDLDGIMITIKKDGSAGTITVNTAETIDGAGSDSLTSAYEVQRYVAYNDEWFKV